MKGKKILITGGLGFIGSNLAHKCLELGAEVTIFDNLDPHSGGNMYNIAKFKHDVKLALHDLLNFDQLSQCILDKDVVFNCAASTSHPFSMRDPAANTDANVKGTLNVLEALHRFNPTARFIHLGTSTQLGPLKYRPADELHPEFPTDIYSANKSVSEKHVLIYAKAFGMKATVIRLANIFGPRACINSPEFTFNNYFIGLALQGKPITVFGDGAQKRNVMYVDDAILSLISAAEAEQTIGDTFFAVGEEHISVADIAQTTVDVLGTGTVQFIPWPDERKVIEIGDAIISNKKIKAITNWQSEYNLRDGLKETGRYYADCLDKYI
jgi:UDP-glucose 4-epimerase